MVQERTYNYFAFNPQLHVLFILDKMNIIFTGWMSARSTMIVY